VHLDLPALLDRVHYRYPSLLIDAVGEHEPGARLTAFKNLTINEDFFPGHFPGSPVMPAVLTIEALTQVAAVLILEQEDVSPTSSVSLRGVNHAKFRRQVLPGDRLTLEVSLRRRRATLAKAEAVAYVGGQRVAEAELLLAIEPGAAYVDPTAQVHPAARIGRGTIIGANCTIGPEVTIGARCRIDPSVVIDGWTDIGDETHIFPMASIGLAPQDLKYRGEHTRLVVGRRNIIREFATINRGTAGGGGQTTIGDQNLLMAYVHVAHDCNVGSHTIFGPHATLGGHVTVEDYSNISAGSAVHQFCRVGKYGFIGGYSVVTKDAPPFGRTIGSRPARFFGVNSVGLVRRGFSTDTINQLKRAYRYLVQANTTHALAQIESDPTLSSAEVRYLVDFIRTSQRGAIIRRPARKAEELVAEE
jgi:UDP-N-acetylglucosamine acyltransferase